MFSRVKNKAIDHGSKERRNESEINDQAQSMKNVHQEEESELFLNHENEDADESKRQASKLSASFVSGSQKKSTSTLLSNSSHNKNKKFQQQMRKAKLAKEETIDSNENLSKCFRLKMLLNFIKRKRIFIPIIIISLIAAIYCLPYVEIEPRIPAKLPQIPFNFRDGPLKESSFNSFRVERLFYGQFHGPESIALDSTGNMYMAVEGGFILYAHLNKSSPIKRSYYDAANLAKSSNQNVDLTSNNNNYLANQISTVLQYSDIPELVKIAELNAIKQIPYDKQRRARDQKSSAEGGSWRRECKLDEEVYGSKLANLIESPASNDDQRREKKFFSNVVISRCSKPLGVRLSPDESYLYVVDTLDGLYRINLKVSDRPNSTQRLVTKLIDFRLNKHQYIPVAHQLAEANEYFDGSRNGRQLTPTTGNLQATPPATTTTLRPTIRAKSYLNISLQAIDDLVIDYGAGSHGGDIIYLSDASQSWQAVSVLYDMLEGRPSGAILRFDTGSNQLSVLDPNRVAHVRTASHELNNINSRLYTRSVNISSSGSGADLETAYMGIGAPRLDENDVFDDRPLYFPNGLEFTDDRQAILIADTVNKRIIKHYIRGVRKGTSDLWAWTPNFPDNIRRGFDKQHETYWVVGCGQDSSEQAFDLLSWLQSYPRLRKYILKNVYLFGWLIETIGKNLFASTSLRDFGYSFKIGHSLCQSMCPRMIILQYNKHGDIIRSIHSREFPNDLAYYSQVNELIDAKTQEHILYLSSPAYKYVTKLTLPTDSFDATYPTPTTTTSR